MYTIDIDVGGTFTDGFFTEGAETRQRKVHTTPHDLTVGISECVAAGASAFDLSVGDLLRHTEVVRLSTTIGTNTIIQRTGPRMGLLVTAGHEAAFYGEGPRGAVSESFVPPELVRGIPEAVDEHGTIVHPLDEAAALQAVRELVGQNVRMIVISLRHAVVNPAHERRLRELVEERYPTHYLRYVPIQLSTEVSDVPDDAARTYAAIFNAYLHRDMVRTLYKAEDDLRGRGYHRPLLIVHTNGGVARVAKTMAIHTYGSGPAGGLVGAAEVLRLYDAPNVITSDVGGTSVDVGLLTEQGYALNLRPTIEGLSLSVPMIELASIGAGGGSIARVENGELKVGPRSAGALPGPACYDRGGTEPTVTDADLALGYLDPAYFLGGQMRLVPERAEAAIRTRVAEPLGLSVMAAAYRIKQAVDRDIGAYLAQMIAAAGKRPEDFLLFAFGGAGPAHCAGYSAAAGLNRVLTFPYGSVFNAFGASRMDVGHTYLKSLPIAIPPINGGHQTDWSPVGPVVERLRARALQDMRGEGFVAEAVRFALEVVVTEGADGNRALVPSPSLAPTGEADTRAVVEGYQRAQGGTLRHRSPSSGPAGELRVEAVVLTATAPLPHYQPVVHEPGPADPSEAQKGERLAYWGTEHQATRVYQRERLASGHVVVGPALIEGQDTTYVIPPGYRFTVDRYLNGLIETGSRSNGR